MNSNGEAARAQSGLEPLVRKLGRWQQFDQAERDAILALPFTTQRAERHQYLVRDQDRPTHCRVLLSGFAMRHKIVSGGQRQIVSIHMKGELVDLQNSMLGCADHSVQMLTDGEVAKISIDAIRELAFDRPRIGEALWMDTLVDGSIFREWIANIGRRDARTRIAHLLCELSLRLKVTGLGDETDYELPLTQEQLADATGLTSVHVNRTIKLLEKDGLIERTNPRLIRVPHWRNLANAGDFSSAYLHLDADEH